MLSLTRQGGEKNARLYMVFTLILIRLCNNVLADLIAKYPFEDHFLLKLSKHYMGHMDLLISYFQHVTDSEN